MKNLASYILVISHVVMKLSWVALGILLLPALDGRFGFVTSLAIVALNVALISTIAFFASMAYLKS